MWEDFVYQVEHKDAKKSNEMYYYRFTKVIGNFFMTKDPSISRRNKFDAILPVKLTNEAIKNYVAYKEYYAIASRAEPPKTKASVKKTQSSSDTTMPPPVAKGTILQTSAKVDKPTKGKQPAKSSTAKGLTVLSEVALTEAKQMKLSTKRSLTLTHISQASGSGADEGTGLMPGVPDVPTYKSDEEISWKSSDEDDDDDVQQNNEDDDQIDLDNDGDDFVHPKFSTHDEEAKHEESFDPIVQTPSHMENSNDEGNDDDSHGMNVGGNEGSDAEDDDNELYGDLNINREGFESLFESTPWVDVPVTTTDLLNFGSLFGFDHRLKNLEANFSEFMQTNQFAEAVSTIPGIIDRYLDHRMNEAVKVVVQLQSDKTSYVVAADLSELELKKILIEKMESNKSIHQSDQQKNLYNALVDAYECDKIILETYGDTVTLKMHRDDEDKDEEPPTGSDRGSKKRRAGKEPESTSALKEKESKTFGAADDQPVVEASQYPDWFPQQAKPPTPDRDLKRLRIQDIKDMLLLLVQGKLTNLTVEERLAFNVSLRMFTISIVIQQRVEDLQLGVKSYQKKINLTKLDTYRSDLKRKKAYTAYSNPRGFIYQNKDKQNRGRIEAIDADEEITLVDMETQADLGVEVQGRKEDDNDTIKEACAAEPTVFNDEKVTMTMAQKLIKMKYEKARLLDE
nr:hypothetical protein [Tanacetum cinerariifolium]